MTTLTWRIDPEIWRDTSDTLQAALVRRDQQRQPLDADDDEIRRMAGGLVSYIRAKGTTNQQPFQKSYGEALVRHCPDLHDAFHRIIVDQWKHKGQIGHYELYAGLVMGDQDPEMLAPTLSQIRELLKTWNNAGWCPWTPALWIRILWLGRDQIDSAATLTGQLEYIQDQLDDAGQFQDREPFCLMHAIGQIDHPIALALRDRFTQSLIARQQADGSWGDFSYIAHTLVDHWN